MRVILILAVLVVVVLGATFAAINLAPVAIDFYFFELHLPVGLAELGALLIGWLLGGLVAWVGQVPRRRRRTREAQQRSRTTSTPSSPGDA